MEEFHYVILGDEPGGLWLARRLSEELRDVVPEPRIAWISFTETLKPTIFPRKLAPLFQVTPGDAWSAEIVTPGRVLKWDDASLARAFPELPPTAFGDPQGSLGASQAQLSAIRYAIRCRPELLSFASGLWKALGRAHRLHAESVVYGALLCTELFHWDAAAEVPPGVERIVLSPDDNPLEALKAPRSGGLSLQFKGRAPLRGQKWILNTSFRRLHSLSSACRDLLDLLHFEGSMRAQEALYPFHVRAESRAIPCTVGPLSVWFDTEEIPELHSEVWPIEVQNEGNVKRITVGASAPRELSLEAVLDRYREGMRRLNRLFPFLAESLIQVGVPLSMDSCFREEDRARALREIDTDAVEWYSLTSAHTQTRSDALEGLFPFLHCHLPYPIGPLQAAGKLLTELTRRKKKKPATAAIPPEVPTVNP